MVVLYLKTSTNFFSKIVVILSVPAVLHVYVPKLWYILTKIRDEIIIRTGLLDHG